MMQYWEATLSLTTSQTQATSLRQTYFDMYHVLRFVRFTIESGGSGVMIEPGRPVQSKGDKARVY